MSMTDVDLDPFWFVFLFIRLFLCFSILLFLEEPERKDRKKSIRREGRLVLECQPPRDATGAREGGEGGGARWPPIQSVTNGVPRRLIIHHPTIALCFAPPSVKLPNREGTLTMATSLQR